MRTNIRVSILALGLACATPALADDTAGCTGFSWPLDTELSWMAAADRVSVESGGSLPAPPAKAIMLALKPAKSVTPPVAPGIKSAAVAPDTFSGWLTLADIGKPGLYQVTLSKNAWIDVAQNGALVPSKAFTGRRECAAIHKSVRFEMGSGPASVQISGAPTQAIEIAIRPAN